MSENLQIDNLDKKILDIITKNARVPYLEVARECGVSGAAIHQRVQRLIRIGVIRGSEFKVDPVMVGFKTCAYIGIFLDHPGHFREVITKFRDIPEIIECHYTTGNYSLFIKVYTRDNEHLRMILTDTIQNIPGIGRTETLISLEESITDRSQFFHARKERIVKLLPLFQNNYSDKWVNNPEKLPRFFALN